MRLVYHHHGNPWLSALGGAFRSATGPSPQLAPPVRTQRFRSRCSRPRAPRPAPENCSPGTRAATLLLPAGATPARFPHGIPPFPGGRDAVLLPRRNRKDVKKRRGGASTAGIREPGPPSRHCVAPEAEPGIGQPDGGGAGRGGGRRAAGPRELGAAGEPER